MKIYEVKSGDSLSKIARDVLGNMSRWPEIAKLNNLVAPYTIFPGAQLLLPEGDTLGPIVIDRGVPATTTPASTPPQAAGVVPFQMTPQAWLYLGIGALFLYLSMDSKK